MVAGLFGQISAPTLDTSKLFILEAHLGNISDPLSPLFEASSMLSLRVMKNITSACSFGNILSRYEGYWWPGKV